MKELVSFLEKNFELLFAFCLLGVVGASLFYAWRRRVSGPRHHPISASSTTFTEKYVSGFPPKSLVTRFGGGRHALVVTVSNDAVLIEPIALLKWLMPFGLNHLAHYIPKSKIVSVQPASTFGRMSLQIEFRSDEGEKKTVELILRKPHEFLAALKLRTFNNHSGEGVIAFVPWGTSRERDRDRSRWYCHLNVAGERVFEYGSPCGTCGIVFRKLRSTDHQVSDSEAVQLLGALDALPSDAAIGRLAKVLPRGRYRPLIIEGSLARVEPGSKNDYFATDVVRLFGLEPPDRTEPAGPKTPYYRLGSDHELARTGGFKALVTAVVMPLHDFNSLSRERVEYWKRQLNYGVIPTAFAVSVVDDQAPAMEKHDRTYRYEEQLLFANCLIDGHHRLQAASETGARVRLLSLLTTEFSLAVTDDIIAVVKPFLR